MARLSNRIFTLLIGFFFLTVHAKPITFFNRFESEIYTESQPVEAFAGDFNQTLKPGGDSAFTYNKLEFGLQVGNWGLGYQTRYDYILAFDPDTALYTYLEKNNLPFEQRNYTYQLDAQHAISHGMFFFYQWSINDYGILLMPKLSVIGNKHYQNGVVAGSVFADNPQGDLRVDYSFSKDRLFKAFDVADRPQGIGIAIDLNLRWQYNERTKVTLDWLDAFYRSSYRRSPFVSGEIRSIPFSTGSDGIVNSQPTVTLLTHENGNHKERNLRLPMRINFIVDHRLARYWSLQGQIRQYADDTFLRTSFAWHMDDTWSLRIGYQGKSRHWLIGIEAHYFTLSLMTDNLDLDKAFYASINTQFKVQF